MPIKNFLCLILLAAGMLTTPAEAASKQTPAPLVIQEQGSFAVGGTVIPAQKSYDPLHPQAAEQTLRGDHASVFYQKPVNARKYSLVFLHGAGQSSRTWESTPDGREGFQNLFLRRGYSVYLVDQPRRGRAGRSTVSMNVQATPDEQFWFGQFRMGVWPDFFENTQFAKGEKALDQFFRQMTPNTGPYDAHVISDAMTELLSNIGPGILVTHSQGCGPGWITSMKSKNVRGIVAYEPGSGFVFPEEEAPDPIDNTSSFGPLSAGEVPLDQFMALTRIPIVIYYGDNIPAEPVNQPHQDYWRAALRMARLWADAVNRHGGDAVVIHLPEAGLTGNTHFPFSDLNNEKVAEHLANWLHKKGLD